VYRTPPFERIQSSCRTAHPAKEIICSLRYIKGQRASTFTCLGTVEAAPLSAPHCTTLHHTAPHCTTLQRTSASDVPVQAALSNDNTVGLQTSSEHLQSARWAASLLAPATVEDLDPPETQGSAQVAVLHDV